MSEINEFGFIICCMAVFFLIVFAIKNAQNDPARVLGDRLITQTVTCDINHEKVSHCQINKGSNLDSVVQEWYDLYEGNVQSGDEGDPGSDK